MKAIAIARTETPNGSPNWEVLAFDPELPPAGCTQTIGAIESIRGQYVLTPFVNQPRKRQKIFELFILMDEHETITDPQPNPLLETRLRAVGGRTSEQVERNASPIWNAPKQSDGSYAV